jgi:hypothetical protein
MNKLSYIIAYIIAFLIIALLFMLLWNFYMVDIVNIVNPINFEQSLAFLIIIRILFGISTINY